MRRLLAVLLLLLMLPVFAQDAQLTATLKLVAATLTAASVPKEGRVLAIDVKTGVMTIALGAKHALYAGQLLRVSGFGKAITADGQVWGREENPIGQAQVLAVINEGTCTARMTQKMPGKAPAVGVYAYPQAALVVGMTGFTRGNGTETQLGIDIADALGVLLQAAPEKLQVLERFRFAEMLAEKKLTVSALFDPTRSAPLKRTPLQAAVVGTIEDDEAALWITARLLALDSGKQLGYCRVSCRTNPALQQRFATVPLPANGAAVKSDALPAAIEARVLQPMDQAQLLTLLKEFGPAVAALRAEIRALQQRVAQLEQAAAQPVAPVEAIPAPVTPPPAP